MPVSHGVAAVQKLQDAPLCHLDVVALHNLSQSHTVVFQNCAAVLNAYKMGTGKLVATCCCTGNMDAAW